MDKALELLSFRARSESELERRLRRAGHEDAAVSHALSRCRELGYVDDEAFALAHVRDRLRLRPRGRRALRTELHRKGVSRPLAERAIDEGFAEFDVDEAAIARGLARSRLAKLGDGEPDAIRRRLAGYLARRGFPPGVVREAVADAVAARPEGSRAGPVSD